MDDDFGWMILLGILAGCLLFLMFVFGYETGKKDATPSPLPLCQYEDDHNCQWNADRQGNGHGRSFVDIDGRTYYLGK